MEALREDKQTYLIFLNSLVALCQECLSAVRTSSQPVLVAENLFLLCRENQDFDYQQDYCIQNDYLKNNLTSFLLSSPWVSPVLNDFIDNQNVVQNLFVSTLPAPDSNPPSPPTLLTGIQDIV